MNGDCLKQSVVYQATVSTNDGRPDQTYVGLTENSFKTRFANHKASFSTPSKKHSTELSKHIWQLKDTKTDARKPLLLRILVSSSATPLMYGKTAKPFWESGGSVYLKNIPTNSSGNGMTSEVDFFFTMYDIVANG